MAKFQSLRKTLEPYGVAGRQAVRDYVMSAGGKPKAGSPFSKAQADRITDLAKQLGAARRTVERWATKSTQQREVGAKYKDKLNEILPKEDRKLPAVTLRFKGTIKISDDESYRDGGAGAPGVRVELSGAELAKLIEKVEREDEDELTVYDDDDEPNDPGEYILFKYGSGGAFSKGGSRSNADPVFKID